MLAVCLVVRRRLLDISEFESSACSPRRGAGFLSNALLWSEAGYFDEAGGLQAAAASVESGDRGAVLPALAGCALPVGAVRGVRCGRLRSACAAASFALNLYLCGGRPVADFYFIFSRIWELLLGAALALAAAWRARGRPLLANGVAAIGVAPHRRERAAHHRLSTLSRLARHRADARREAADRRRTGHPRQRSHPGCAANGGDRQNFLSDLPLALAAARLRALRRGRRIRSARALGVDCDLGHPVAGDLHLCREADPVGRPRARRTAYAAVAIAALGLVGLRDFREGGLFLPNATFVRIVNEGDIGYRDYGRFVAARSTPCDAKTFSLVANRPVNPLRCGQSIAGASPEIVILGDSHADHLYAGLVEALPGHNVADYAESAMPSIEDPSFASVYQALAATPSVKAVVVSGAWKIRLSHLRKGENFREEFDRTARFLIAAGKRVYFVNDVPYFSTRVGRCKFAGGFGLPHRCDEDESELESQLAPYAGDLAAVVAANPGARLIDTAHTFCAGGRCSMAADGKLLYRDSNHLNINGTLFIGAKIVAAAPDLAE